MKNFLQHLFGYFAIAAVVILLLLACDDPCPAGSHTACREVGGYFIFIGDPAIPLWQPIDECWCKRN